MKKINFRKTIFLIIFVTIFLQLSFTEAGNTRTYTDPKTGITHYYNNKGELIGSSFVGEHGLEVHAKEGENIYVDNGNNTEEPTQKSKNKVIPRTEYEAKSRNFQKPHYVNTPLGKYKVKSITYNTDGTLKTLEPAEKITLKIPQGTVSAFDTVIFGQNNIPKIIEIPDTLTWNKKPNTIRIGSKIFFWDNGNIKRFSTYHSDTIISTPIGKYYTDSSIDFYDNGAFKRFAFYGWEKIKTPVGTYMIDSVGFNDQNVPTYYSFSENNSFTINGVKYKRNCTLKISPSGKVLGVYDWDNKNREWKPK